ncbi:hypothetical protein Hypma_014661 [Hypsizygus marmoreus]|uniref:F-box domain-containing protein n=1 Tax=Hypsizygus marmoreus TaxID=39966 RepID=A0A369JE78_HYPMA|nr:hypothetical protein Hypma_014661 [Hypsizygus marmoreus]
MQTHPAHPLETPELLGAILAYSSKKVVTSNLFLSKRWFSVGREILWKSLENQSDFENLLSLLGELVDRSPGGSLYNRLNLDGYPQADKWKKFQEYSILIRSIHLPNLHSYAEACALISLNRPFLDLFPSLGTLHYNQGCDDNKLGLQYLPLFLQPSILRFSVRLPDLGVAQGYLCVIQVIETIPKRMPHLVYLEITSRNLSVEALLTLHQVVGDLQNLETLILPSYCVVGDIIDVLALHERIREIKSKDIQGGGLHRRLVGAGRWGQPYLFPESYQALEFLTFCADAQSATKFLEDPHFPSGIGGLHLEMPIRESASTVASLFQIVQQTCPCLEDFRFSDAAFAPDPGSPHFLPYRTFVPILSYPTLTVLHVHHHRALPWTEGQLMELARSLPLIESLRLNESPLEAHVQPSVPFPILLAFAQHCPNLKCLGLFLDASSPFVCEELGFFCFRVLQDLHLGLSPVSPERLEDVLVLLTRLLPSTCDIILSPEPSSSSTVWGEVVRLRDLFSRVQNRATQPTTTAITQTSTTQPMITIGVQAEE